MPTTATFRGYPTLLGKLKRIAGWSKSADFRADLQRAGGILAEGHLLRLTAGIRGDGAPVIDREGIIARRKGRYRGEAGGPQAPRGRASRAWTGYRWQWTSSGNTHTFTDRIDGPAWITARVRKYGYGGVSPRTRARLAAHFRDAHLKLLKAGPSG
jgi:hypothetical protein